MKKLAALVLLVAGAVSLQGCATYAGDYGPGGAVATQQGAEEIRRGTIVRIDPVTLEGSHQLGLGAVLGAAAGGLVGNQIGRGGGREVATVLGALGGGLLGNEVQNQQVDRRDGQSVFVQLHNGVTIAVTQVANPDLYVGQPVYVEGAGQSARVIPRH